MTFQGSARTPSGPGALGAAVAEEASLDLRVSLHEGDPPPPGILTEPLVWDDVLRVACPTSIYLKEHRYVVSLPEITDASVRVEQTVILGVVECPDGTARVEVEDRLSVAPRALAAALEAEQATVGRFVRRARRRGDRTFRRQERKARRLRREGGAAGAVGRSLRAVVALERRAWHGALSGARGLTRAVAGFPDFFRARWAASAQLLANPAGRQRIRQGLANPQTLTTKEKAVTLFVGTLALVAALVLLHLGVTLIAPGVAGEWRTVFALFVYGYFQSLGLPLPIEPVLIPASLVIGIPATVAVTVLAKVLAGYMAFYLGDEVHDRILLKAAERPRFGRFLDWSKRFAGRYGTFAMAFFIAVPGFPDAVALYVFGSLGMPLRKYLLGIAIGGTLLYASVLYGIHHLLALL